VKITNRYIFYTVAAFEYVQRKTATNLGKLGTLIGHMYSLRHYLPMCRRIAILFARIKAPSAIRRLTPFFRSINLEEYQHER